MIQLTLTLKITTAQVVETSVTVNNDSPIQDYVHPDDQTQPTFEMTPGFKPFTEINYGSNTLDEDKPTNTGEMCTLLNVEACVTKNILLYFFLFMVMIRNLDSVRQKSV